MSGSCYFWRKDSSGHLLPENAKTLEAFLRKEFHSVPFKIILRREVNAVEITPLGKISWDTIEGRLSQIGFMPRPFTFSTLALLLWQMIKESLRENMSL